MPRNDPRHRAKRWNEHIKLAATLFNSVAIVALAAALINPLASRHYDVLTDGGWLLLFGAAILHAMAHYTLSFLDAED